jgi:hypothetical protein
LESCILEVLGLKLPLLSFKLALFGSVGSDARK